MAASALAQKNIPQSGRFFDKLQNTIYNFISRFVRLVASRAASV
jgi:hypothetical protein